MTVEVDTDNVSLVSYHGRNGVGSAHAPTLTYTNADRPCLAVWEHSYDDDLGVTQTWVVRQADAIIQWSGSGAGAVCAQRRTAVSVNGIDLIVTGGITTTYRITITIYGDWGEQRNIGDYAGDLEKTDCSSEALIPYAAQWYQAIRSARGSAYTKRPLTVVDFENLAIARMMAGSFSRTSEKLVANSLPAHADEKLDYWVEVLGVPAKPDDPPWVLRQRCAAHYQAALGPTLEAVSTALGNLLGQAFVQIHVHEGTDLDNEPVPTYWPAGTRGEAVYSIGGPTWLSRRAHLRIEVQQPPGVTLSDFLQLMNVQMFQLLDRMLPAWVTWNWSEGSDGFRVNVDRIGIDAL